MPPLPVAIILLLAPFAPRFSRQVWGHAQSLLLGAILTRGSRTVAAALRVMGLSGERHFTNYHRVLNRATWSVEVTCEEGRAHLGLETQRQWSDQAIARTTPVLLGLFPLVTLLARQLSPDGQIPVPVTAWYHKSEPTFSDCLGLVRQHLWRARYLVHSTPEAEFTQLHREALDLLIHGLSLAA